MSPCVCLCWYLPSAVSYLFPAILIIQCLLTEDSAAFWLWTFPVFILIGRLKMWLKGDDDTQQREWLYPSVGEANVWPSEFPGHAWWGADHHVLWYLLMLPAFNKEGSKIHLGSIRIFFGEMLTDTLLPQFSNLVDCTYKNLAGASPCWTAKRVLTQIIVLIVGLFSKIVQLGN